MVQREELLVDAPGTCIAVVSIFCIFKIVWNAYKVRSTLLVEIEESNQHNGGNSFPSPEKKEVKCRHIILADHIIWLSISDLLLAVWAILSWGTLAFGNTYVSSHSTFCVLIANLNVISVIGSSVWQFFISWTVLTLARKKLCGLKFVVTPENVKIKLKRRIFVWIVFVVFILALFWGQHVFGVEYNLPNHKDPECWVTNKNYSLVELAPIFFDVLFSLFVLGTVLYAYWKQQYNNGNDELYIPPKKKKKIDSKSALLLEESVHHDNENNPLPNEQQDEEVMMRVKVKEEEEEQEEDDSKIKANFVCRTSQLVMIFVFIWGVILVIRAYEMITQKFVPAWVIAIHHCFVGAIPIGNFIVWRRWNTFQDINQL